ncbi:Uncharacterised protein [Bordetella pertussis]|nr:Uncharacterised protein [Bordetella pertussis]CFW45534.1 Uncharacterised protein [Bordetella pertussis]
MRSSNTLLRPANAAGKGRGAAPVVNALLAARLGHAVEHSHAKASTLTSICPRTVMDSGGMPGYPYGDACPMARAVIRARLVE